MNLIFSIILIIASLGIFFGYVDPNYRGTSASLDTTDYSSLSIVQLKDEYKKFSDISNSSNIIVSKRDALINKKNSITEENKAKLERLLPSNIDNIRLIIEISDIAQKRGLIVRNISVGDVKESSNSIGVSDSEFGTLSLKFSVNSSYNNLLLFLKDLQNNLRLVDVTDLSFSATDSGYYDFGISLNTYWLK
ncbi:MAG: type 4a pilus biogenesis protein PilO [bacterium]|jgi:Tfp pilus assembly protein PilO